MLTSFLAVFTALAGVQVLLVVKLADFMTDGAGARGTRTIETDVHGVGIA